MFGKKNKEAKTSDKYQEDVEKEEDKPVTSITVESFVQKHSEIFKGLLTGENTLEFSDSDSEVSDDEKKPKQRRIPVKLTRTQLAQQAAKEAERLLQNNDIVSRMQKKAKERLEKEKKQKKLELERKKLEAEQAKIEEERRKQEEEEARNNPELAEQKKAQQLLEEGKRIALEKKVAEEEAAKEKLEEEAAAEEKRKTEEDERLHQEELRREEEAQQQERERIDEERRKVEAEQQAAEAARAKAAAEVAELRRQEIARRKAVDEKTTGGFKGVLSHRHYSKSEAIKNLLFDKFVLGSTKYFVTSFFVVVTAVLCSIDFYTPENVCCIFDEHVTPWAQNGTRLVFTSAYNDTTNTTQITNHTEAWKRSGVDRTPYCKKYANPHEEFLDVCDDGTARRKVFTDISIVSGCLLVSLFLVFCRLRSKVRRRHPLSESIINLAVYVVFLCVPTCRVPFEIINGDDVGLGSDMQLVLCGLLSWIWLFFMGKGKMRFWSKKRLLMTSACVFLLIIIPLSISIGALALPSYKDTIIDIVPSCVAISCFGLLSLMWAVKVSRPPPSVMSNTNNQTDVHDEAMRWIHIATFELLIFLPVSMSAGLLTQGLYVSPGSVYLESHPLLDASVLMALVAFCILIGLHIVRKKTIRTQVGPTMRWAYLLVVVCTLWSPIPFVMPLMVLRKLQDNTNIAALLLIFMPIIFLVLWNLLVMLKVLQRLSAVRAAARARNLEQPDSSADAATSLSPENRAIVVKYMARVWGLSTLVFVCFVVSCFPPLYVMSEYMEYFLPWKDPIDQIRTPAWLFLGSVLGIGNLICQYFFHTAWKMHSLFRKGFDIVAFHIGLILPIGLMMLMLFNRAYCAISTILVGQAYDGALKELETPRFITVENETARINITDAHRATLQSEFEPYFAETDWYCSTAVSMEVYILIGLGVGITYFVWSSIALRKTSRYSLCQKAIGNMIYVGLVLPTFPVMLYDWGKYQVALIDPTGGYDIGTSVETNTTDYSVCPDPTGKGLLTKISSDIFLMILFLGVLWLATFFLSTRMCYKNRRKGTQVVCVILLSIFVALPASGLWPIISNGLSRWERLDEIDNKEWAWCFSSNTPGPVSTAVSTAVNTTTTTTLPPTTTALPTTTVAPNATKLKETLDPFTRLLSPEMLVCYILFGSNMSLFLLLVDKFWKKGRQKLAYMFILTYTAFVGGPSSSIPYLLYHNEESAFKEVRSVIYFGALMCVWTLVNLTKMKSKMNWKRRIFWASVYMFCIALPTSLGVYELSLEVDFWGTTVNVAGSTFVGLFILIFERYDAYKMTGLPLINRLVVFLLYLTFITVPLLSVALTAYKDVDLFFEESMLDIPLYMSIGYSIWVGLTSMRYVSLYTGFLRQFKQPYASLFPGFAMMMGEAVLFVVLRLSYINRSKGDELPVFELVMLFIFPVYLLGVFGIASMRIRLMDKFLLCSVFGVLGPTYVNLEDHLAVVDPENTLVKMYDFFLVAFPVGSLFCVFLPTFAVPGLSFVDVANVFTAAIVIPLGVFFPIHLVSSEPEIDSMVISGCAVSGFIALIFLVIARRKRRKYLKEEAVVEKGGRPDGFEWLHWFPTNTMEWVSHWFMLLSLLFLMYTTKHFTTETRKNAIRVLFIAAPIMYMIGKTPSLWRCFSHKISLALIATLSIGGMVAALVLRSQKSLFAAIMAGVIVIPGMMISFGILNTLKSCMRDHPRQNHVMSLASALCCIGVLFPFGILFPSLVSTAWDMTMSWGTIFIVSVSALTFVCLIDVSSLTIAVNSTLNTIEYEKRAKAAVDRLQKGLRKRHKNLESDEDSVRAMYDHAVIASHEMGYKMFEKELMDNEILFRIQKKKTVKLLDAVKTQAEIAKHKIRLCPLCVEKGWNTVLTSRRKLNVCMACSIQILLDEKREILRLKQASAEEKEKRRLEKERMYKLECEARKKRNEKFQAAQSFVIERKNEEALALYHELMEEDGFNPNYLCARSIVYSKLKLHEDAFVDANEALAIRPKYINAYIAKATALGSMKRWKDAVETYTIGRKFFPKSKELYKAQQFAVSEMQRLAPPLTLFQFIRRKIIKLSRACDKLQDELEAGIAKFEEELTAGAKNMYDKLNKTTRKREMYEGCGFRIQLVDLQGINRNPDIKSYHCEVRMSTHENTRGYEEVRDGLPDHAERVNKYFKETRALGDQKNLAWKKELVYFQPSLLKGHSVDITLVGITGNGDRRIIGTTSLLSYQIARRCRENEYTYVELTPPPGAPESTDSTKDPTDGDGSGNEGDVEDGDLEEGGAPPNKEKDSIQIGLAFGLSSPKLVDAHSNMEGNEVFMRRVIFEWRKVSVPPVRVNKRVMKEIFGTYASMPAAKEIAEQTRKSTKVAQKQLTHAEMMAKLKEEAIQLRLAAAAAAAAAAAPGELAKEQRAQEVPLKRMSRSAVRTVYLMRDQFARFAKDAMLEDLHPVDVFMSVATTEKTGRYAVDYDEFQGIMQTLAKRKFDNYTNKGAAKMFCQTYLRRTLSIYGGWRTIHNKRVAPKVPKVTDPRLIAQGKVRLQQAAIKLQRLWRKRRLRIKAIKLIRRFIKRKQEWRKAHPTALLERQMAQMTEELEEEMPPMEEDKKVKKTCMQKSCSSLGHFILGTQEEPEEEDSDDEEAVDETDLEGLTEDERMQFTIDDTNRCREGKEWSEVVATILTLMEHELELDRQKVSVAAREVQVNWKNTANIMAFHVALPKILYQYYSIAALHGPLEPTKNSKENMESPHLDLVNTDFLKVLAGFVSLPQFQIPSVDVEIGFNPSFVVFWIAVAIGFLYPLYSIKALRALKAGKLGLDEHGRPVTKFCSKDGLYNFGLNAVNDFMYFGMMVSFVSMFACKIDDLSPLPGDPGFQYVKYILMSDAKYVRVENSSRVGNTTVVHNMIVTYKYPPMECFNSKAPTHIVYMVVCAIALLCFYPLATLLAPNFQFNNKMLDIKFEQSFLIIQNQAELLMVAFSIFYQEDWVAVLVPQFLICTTLAISNWFIQPCLVARLNIFRTATYSMAAVSCFSSIVYQLMKSGFGGQYCYEEAVGAGNCEPFFVSAAVAYGILIIGWATIILVTIVSHKRRWGPDAFKKGGAAHATAGKAAVALGSVIVEEEGKDAAGGKMDQPMPSSSLTVAESKRGSPTKIEPRPSAGNRKITAKRRTLVQAESKKGGT